MVPIVAQNGANRVSHLSSQLAAQAVCSPPAPCWPSPNGGVPYLKTPRAGGAYTWITWNGAA